MGGFKGPLERDQKVDSLKMEDSFKSQKNHQ